MYIIMGDAKIDLMGLDEDYWISKEIFYHSLVAIANGIYLHTLVEMVSISLAIARDVRNSNSHDEERRIEANHLVAMWIHDWKDHIVSIGKIFVSWHSEC